MYVNCQCTIKSIRIERKPKDELSAHPVYGPINARKLDKKAYRKRRKLSAAANSISTDNPGLPLLRDVSHRAFLQPSSHTRRFVLGIKSSRDARIISALVRSRANRKRLIIRRAAGYVRSLSVTHWQNTRRDIGAGFDVPVAMHSVLFDVIIKLGQFYVLCYARPSFSRCVNAALFPV